MSNTPSDAELGQLAEECGIGWAAGLGGMDDFLRAFSSAVLAKWGRSQPVVLEPLTDAQIAEMMRDTWGCASIAPRHAMGFARAIEAEVHKQDEALIRQMHDALCECAEDSQEQLDRMEAAKLRQYKPQAVAFQEATVDAAKRAITAARARLGEKT